MDNLANMMSQLANLLNDISITIAISQVVDNIQASERQIRQRGIFSAELNILSLLAEIERSAGIYKFHLINRITLEILFLIRLGHVDWEIINDWI